MDIKNNPPAQKQRRFKKRYILYGFIVLMVLGGLISAITPNNTTNSTEQATATPAPSVKATPKAVTANFDPLLAKLVPTLKAEYGSDVVEARPKHTASDLNYDAIFIHFVSHGQYSPVEIRNEGSIADASRVFKSLSTCNPGEVKDPKSTTYFGLQEATVALGHAPTTVNDAYCKGTGTDAGSDVEYIQYDQLFIIRTV